MSSPKESMLQQPSSSASLHNSRNSSASRVPSLNLMHIDSAPVLQDDDFEEPDATGVPWLTSERFRLSILYFFGFACLYAQRVNLSIAMVAMVSEEDGANNSISLNLTSNKTGDDCPKLSHNSKHGEFHWDKKLVGLILGAFFWGYLVLQVAGGRLSEKFGAKRVVACGLFPVAVLNILTPVTARIDPYLLLVLRVVVGIGESVMYPSAQALWAKWAPPSERASLIGFTYAGGQFGNAMMFPIGGFLCAYGPDGGWPSVFYFIGTVGFIWCCLWVYYAKDCPNDSKTISEIERNYINAAIGKDSSKQAKPSIPWVSIFTSRPFWAILIAHTCGNYGAYMLLTKIPAYMKEVLKFDIESNGLYSMLPYLAFWAVISIGGPIADKVITSGLLSVKSCRKVFAAVGFIVPGISLIGAGFMTCHQAMGAVALLSLSVGFCGLQFNSFFCNHADIAPMYAGTLFGITNTMATVPGIISPYIVAAMTPHGTREEWLSTFFLAASIYFFGAITYCLMAETDIQPWAVVDKTSVTFKVALDEKDETPQVQDSDKKSFS